MHRPILTRQADGRVQIEAPRSSAFDLDMRVLVPFTAKSRNARTGVWTIDQKWLGAVRLILSEHYGQLYDRTGIGEVPLPENWDILWSRRQHTKPSAPSYSPYAVLYLVEGAPLEVARAAHRALAKLHHPDKGGDPARMQAINDAMDQLEEIAAPPRRRRV